MATFQENFFNFLHLGLFVFAGLSFVIIVQSNDDAAQPVINNSLINNSYVSFGGNLSNLESSSQTQYSQFTGEVPQAGFGSIVLFGIVSAGKTFGNVILGTLSLVLKIPLFILGIPQTVVSNIITATVITIIITAWVLYKLGG